jgi:hypothetical protein
MIPRECLLEATSGFTIKKTTLWVISLMVSPRGYAWKQFEPAVAQLDRFLLEAYLDIKDCYNETEEIQWLEDTKENQKIVL